MAITAWEDPIACNAAVYSLGIYVAVNLVERLKDT